MENPSVFRICDATRFNGTRIMNLTSKVGKNNVTGIKGVHYDKSKGKYVAHIGFKGKNIKLGVFNTLEEAAKARKDAEEKYWIPAIMEYESTHQESEKTLRQRNKKLYWCWKAIKQRCLNPKNAAYKNYGARGIGICDEWMRFDPFCEWALNNGWEEGLDIDRIDNDGDYSPDNCRWTTRMQNINNRRCSVFINVGGETHTIAEWSRIINASRELISYWINKNGMEYAVMRIRKKLSA